LSSPATADTDLTSCERVYDRLGAEFVDGAAIATTGPPTRGGWIS
jgi:hypothetical protein